VKSIIIVIEDCLPCWSPGRAYINARKHCFFFDVSEILPVCETFQTISVVGEFYVIFCVSTGTWLQMVI